MNLKNEMPPLKNNRHRVVKVRKPHQKIPKKIANPQQNVPNPLPKICSLTQKFTKPAPKKTVLPRAPLISFPIAATNQKSDGRETPSDFCVSRINGYVFADL